MKSVRAINIVKNLVIDREKKALLELQEVEQVLLRKNEQLKTLVDYQKNYQQNGQQKFMKRPALMENYDNFMQKIASSIQAEKMQIEQLTITQEQKQLDYQKLHIELQVLQALINRYQQALKAKDRRKQQALEDEWASMKHVQQQSGQV